MTITYQGTSVASGTSSASVSAPASIAIGDVMLCIKGDRATSGTTTAPTGWTRVGNATGTSGRVEIFWGAYGKNGIGSGPWSFSGTTRTLARIVSYRGVNNVSPMDVTPSARYNASGTTGSTSITPLTDGNWIIAAFVSLTANYTWTGEAVATSPSLTERIESAYSTYLDIAVADGTQATAGATGASSGTMSTNGNNAGIIIALRPDNPVTVDLASDPAVVAAGGADPTAVLGSLSVDMSSDPAVAASDGVDPTVQGGGSGPVTVELASDPAAIVSSGVDSVAMLGAISFAPGTADAFSGAVDPGIILGVVVLSPGFAAVLAEGVDPAVNVGGGGPVTVDLSSLPASAASSGIDPSAILGAIVILPGLASVLSEGIDAAVVLGSIVFAPEIAQAASGGTDPTILLSSFTMSPTFAVAIAEGIPPSVIHGAIVLTPAAAAILTEGIDPDVLGQWVVMAVDEAYVLPGMLRRYKVMGVERDQILAGMIRKYKRRLN